MNRRGDACEGLVQFDETGVSATLNAVLEPCAVKVACTVPRGPRFREERGYPITRMIRPSGSRMRPSIRLSTLVRMGNCVASSSPVCATIAAIACREVEAQTGAARFPIWSAFTCAHPRWTTA